MEFQAFRMYGLVRLSLQVLLGLGFSLSARGETLLTSADFWKSWSRVDRNFHVVLALETAHDLGTLDEELLEFLSSKDFTLGQKFAMANALTHSSSAGLQSNAALYKEFLARKYGSAVVDGNVTPVSLRSYDVIFGEQSFEYPRYLEAHELLILGYLLAMENYRLPQIAVPYLYGAMQKAPGSFAARVAFALTLGNVMLEADPFDLPATEFFRASGKVSRSQMNRAAELKDFPSESIRFGYTYKLFIPLLAKIHHGEQDFEVGAFDDIMVKVYKYKKHFQQWQSETAASRLQSEASKFECQFFLEPNDWDPAGENKTARKI